MGLLNSKMYERRYRQPNGLAPFGNWVVPRLFYGCSILSIPVAEEVMYKYIHYSILRDIVHTMKYPYNSRYIRIDRTTSGLVTANSNPATN